MSRSSSFCSMILASFLIVWSAAPGLAQEIQRTPPIPDDLEADEAREPKERRVDFRLALTTELDDNILHLRDDSIDQFESGDFAPDRFLVKSVDDVIFIPSFDLAFSVTPQSRKKSRVRLSTTIYQYKNNSIKDSERYTLTFEQDFSDARIDLRALELARKDLAPSRFRARRSFRLANRSRLRLSYKYGPERYQNQLFDDDGGGRKSTSLATEGWDAIYYQRLNSGESNRLRLVLRAKNGEVDYNSDFDERDSNRDGYALGLDLFTLRPNSYWQWGLMYEFSERRSNTALIGQKGPAGTIEDDLSYDAEVINVKARRFWYREKGRRSLYKSNDFGLSVRFGDKDYITENQNDRTHFGRNDDFLAVTAAFTYALSNHATLRFRLEYAEQQTNLDPVDGFDRLEPSDFDNVVFGVQMNYFTGWKSKTRRPARDKSRKLPVPLPEPARQPAAQPDATPKPEVAVEPEVEVSPLLSPAIEDAFQEEPESILFNFASARISEEGRAKLDEIGRKMTKEAKMHARVIGHSDNRGSEPANLRFSLERAEEVKRYLVERHQVAGSRILTEGMGALEPLASNETEEGRSQNRRVVVISMVSPRLPSADVASRAHEAGKEDASGSATDITAVTPPSSEIFELQLGLFHYRENALVMVDNVTERGYRPYIVEVESSKGESRYTVRIGPYRSMEEAAAMAQEILKAEDMATVIRFRTAANR